MHLAASLYHAVSSSLSRILSLSTTFSLLLFFFHFLRLTNLTNLAINNLLLQLLTNLAFLLCTVAYFIFLTFNDKSQIYANWHKFRATWHIFSEVEVNLYFLNKTIVDTLLVFLRRHSSS